MSDNKQCIKCQKQFDPGYDFCEDIEACEAIMYFADIEDFCGDCTWALINDIHEFVGKKE